MTEGSSNAMPFRRGESSRFHQKLLSLDLIWTSYEPHGSVEGSPWALGCAVFWKNTPGCCSPWCNMSQLISLLLGSVQLYTCPITEQQGMENSVLSKIRKSMSSASLAMLILVNYSAAVCNLSVRWIQLKWKRANLKVKVFYFLCKAKGHVEFPA